MTLRPRPRMLPLRPAAVRQRGQAMIEYFVVLAFSVILLTKPLPQAECSVVANCPPTCGATSSCPSAVELLSQAMRDYHSHYAFAMAVAYVPNCDVPFNLSKTLSPSDISNGPSVLLQASGTIDPCIDLSHPQLPIPDFSSISMSFEGFGASIIDALGDYVVDEVKKQIDHFFDPADLLSSFGFSFSLF